MNPIEKAVRPLKVDAVTRAEQDARAYVVKCQSDLEEHGWDINAAAPYPMRSAYGSVDYHVRRFKHDHYHALTSLAEGHRETYRPNEPRIVAMDEKKIERFVEMRKKLAAEQYEAFVAKLIAKIGEVKKATLAGNHVWAHSILTVVTAGGETQRWMTQQITNVSKLGKYFNQWPTRKVK
jgi:hypothetical protein